MNRLFGSWNVFSRICFLAAIGTMCFLAGSVDCAKSDNMIDDPTEGDYVQRVEQWREENERSLASPTGWLALTGHFWLEKGENLIGTRSTDSIQIPDVVTNDPLGSFWVDELRRVFLISKEGSMLRVNGEFHPKIELPLDPFDPEANCNASITLGERIRLQLVRRSGKLAVRVRDALNERIAFFAGKKWFPVDPRFRLVGKFVKYDRPKEAEIVNIRSEAIQVEMVGVVTFEFEGQVYELFAMAESNEELFIVFRDASSGKTTYAPGRFLNCKVPKDDDLVELDFNKAYNPPCAFSPFTLCPLPPKQNVLDFEVNAGEKYQSP